MTITPTPNTLKAPRHPRLSVSELVRGTVTAPMLRPSHIKPNARPRCLFHQLATAVVIELMNPMLDPKLIPIRKMTQKIGKFGAKLASMNPKPISGIPKNMSVLGPSLSTR